mgnify:CR=1 FL=1
MTSKPRSRARCERSAICVKKPAATSSMAYSVTLNAMICAVTVVPMFAPMITPMDCCIVSSPAETKPTSKTVVTLDD